MYVGYSLIDVGSTVPDSNGRIDTRLLAAGALSLFVLGVFSSSLSLTNHCHSDVCVCGHSSLLAVIRCTLSVSFLSKKRVLSL